MYTTSVAEGMGTDQLLNDLAGLASAQEMVEATVYPKYAEFQYNVTTLLCTPR